MRRETNTQTDTQTAVTTILFASAIPHAKRNKGFCAQKLNALTVLYFSGTTCRNAPIAVSLHHRQFGEYASPAVFSVVGINGTR